jgi:hypothetical protein
MMNHTISTPETAPLAESAELKANYPFTTRDFCTRMIRIWDEVQRFKQVGYIKTDDDRYFIAYRTAENELREVCEENQLLKSKLGLL